jgi:hypothetical protein
LDNYKIIDSIKREQICHSARQFVQLKPLENCTAKPSACLTNSLTGSPTPHYKHAPPTTAAAAAASSGGGGNGVCGGQQPSLNAVLNRTGAGDQVQGGIYTKIVVS